MYVYIYILMFRDAPIRATSLILLVAL
jgi:hypothetical protein